MTAIMDTSHAQHPQPHQHADARLNATSSGQTSLERKKEELNSVERQLARARSNLSRLKRYWTQLDDDEKDQLLDQLDIRDRTGNVDNKPVKTAKKKVIVGNTSSFVPEDHREETDQFTHKWMIYVRGPKEEPDLSWVKKVRITLHPSFAPNDIVDLHNPPFHLSRRGYGEFPVNVQLFLFDPRAEPIDITHNLTLDKESTGKQIIGPETVVEVEMAESVIVPHHARSHGSAKSSVSPSDHLTANTELMSPAKRQKIERASTPSSVTRAAPLTPSKERFAARSGAVSGGQLPRVKPPATTGTEVIIPSHPCMKYDNQLKREMTETEKLIHDAVTKYPLIVTDGKAPYLCAKSNDEFMSWTIGKRKACERFRAIYVQKYVKAKFNRDIKVVDICRFSRLAGLSPVVVQNETQLLTTSITDPRKRDQSTSIRYCHYCGIAPPQSDFERHRDRCKNFIYKVADAGVNSAADIALSRQQRIRPSATGSAATSKTDPSQYIPPPLSRGYVKSVHGCHEFYRRECHSVRKVMAQIGIVDHYYTGSPDSSLLQPPSVDHSANVDRSMKLSNTEATLGKMADLMLVKALKCFTKSIVNSSVTVFQEERNREQNQISRKRNPQAPRSSTVGSNSTSRLNATSIGSMSSEDSSGTISTRPPRSSANIDRKILTPFHVYRAITKNPGTFDFLANNRSNSL